MYRLCTLAALASDPFPYPLLAPAREVTCPIATPREMAAPPRQVVRVLSGVPASTGETHVHIH